MLTIPLYKQLSYVMFYDVLQMLCHKVNLVNFNKQKIKDDRRKAKVLKQFGLVKVKDEFDYIMNDKDETRLDFDKLIRNMGRLNPKIKLMIKLQHSFKKVHESYAIYADTEQTLAVKDLDRRLMKSQNLRAMNRSERNEKDDLNVYTTKHYFYGIVIVAAWKGKMARKAVQRRRETIK